MVRRGRAIKRKVIDRQPMFGRLQNKRGIGVDSTVEVTLRMAGARGGSTDGGSATGSWWVFWTGFATCESSPLLFFT